MLTGELVKPRIKKRGDELTIDLLKADNKHWQQNASNLIQLLQEQLGQTHQDWDDAVETYIGDSLDYVVIRGLAKVLSDASTFTPLETPLDPEELRAALFAQGPVFAEADLFHQRTRRDVIRDTAKKFHTAQKHIESALFADRPSEYILTETGDPWTADSLISRYNLELARGVLYWSNEMQVTIYDHYKDFWRYLKLFKLMFWAHPVEGGYDVTLDGPIFPFVKSTLRYGRQLAAFLPALFLADKWEMSANVRYEGDELTYQLDYRTPLSTHFKASGLFDSRLEADFAAEFEAKFGQERGDWLLSREDEVLLLGDTVMIPDFAVTHKKDGRRALIEIMGCGHPQYLRLKLEKVRAAGRHDLILLVYEGVNLSEEQLKDVPSTVLHFKNKPVLKDVMAVIEQVAI
jgi:uncharacterized protein